MRVAFVLRSGGEYRPEHVERLAMQVEAHLPGAEIVCLSDVPVPVERIALVNRWPGWWSKMELFAPWVEGDLLYLDLDSAVVGDLTDMASIDRLTIMRDVYRAEGLQSSVMFLPEMDRARVWREWMRKPEVWMGMYRCGGDQAFLERLWLGKATIWQDTLPGQVVSYKVDVRQAVRTDREFGNGTVPDGARVIAFHGKPRPWDVGW
jgi:hypothetical protein